MRLSLRIDGMCFKHFGRMLNLFGCFHFVTDTFICYGIQQLNRLQRKFQNNRQMVICQCNALDPYYIVGFGFQCILTWVFLHISITYESKLSQSKFYLVLPLSISTELQIIVRTGSFVWDDKRDTVCNVHGIKCSTIIVIKRNSLCVFFTCFVAFWSLLLMFWWYRLELAIFYI